MLSIGFSDTDTAAMFKLFIFNSIFFYIHFFLYVHLRLLNNKKKLKFLPQHLLLGSPFVPDGQEQTSLFSITEHIAPTPQILFVQIA